AQYTVHRRRCRGRIAMCGSAAWKREPVLAGALLGAFTGLALTAIYFLGQMVAGLPFVPFDIFDQLSRVLPGGIITVFIETMVAVIQGLNLGPIAGVAKLIEQSLAVAMVVIAGAVFGAVLATLRRRYHWSGSRPGAVGGLVLLILAIAVESARGIQANPVAAVLWMAVTTVGWGALLGRWVEDATRGVGTPGLAAENSMSRRAFLAKIASGSLALAVASFGLGRFLEESRQPTGASEPLPSVAGATPPPVPTVAIAGRTIQPVPGTRPEVTPNAKFYRIDIDLLPPTIHEDSWTVQVAGLFDRPRALTLRDLQAYPAVTQPYTLSCISNPVGGDLIGNTFWTGLRVTDLMKDLGLHPEATALRIDSADGFFEYVVRADLEDPRTLLVYGMNGETLPVEHGFPLRILIPNRYGMKQPKWITHMTATNESQLGYWVARGWNKEARPQIVSVIDTVAKSQEQNGRIPIGGIAWAGDRGIRRVELQVDGGQWAEATLITPPLGPLTWVEWRYDWPAVSGEHTFRVRATDGTGALQIEKETPTEPDGATGYYSVTHTI
ncbi:MAG: molybdopterin-dependent oxidoreductase, partial [Actinobacteria bacterium]|nr:molybdopterin-dependent oxidoreductase [Actinomycetota bacterium]